MSNTRFIIVRDSDKRVVRHGVCHAGDVASQSAQGETAVADVEVPALDVTATLQWDDGTKTVTAIPNLEYAKAAARHRLTDACALAITGGFQSSPTGVPQRYGSSAQEQSNLLHGRVAPTGAALWHFDAANGWRLSVHPQDQVDKVHGDFVMHLNAQRLALAAKLKSVAAAQTVEAANAVIW